MSRAASIETKWRAGFGLRTAITGLLGMLESYMISIVHAVILNAWIAAEV
jgi:hypothetical protein